MRSTSARWIAVGNASFVDLRQVDVIVRVDRRLAAARVPVASSFARSAITSLTFMLVWVPLPVCHTDERELAVVRARDHLVGGRDDPRRASSAR